jgi:hypothetical protein
MNEKIYIIYLEHSSDSISSIQLKEAKIGQVIKTYIGELIVIEIKKQNLICTPNW